MVVLITGGAGFIGSHTVDKYLDNGYDVVILDNLKGGNIRNINSKANLVIEDIRSKELEKKLNFKDIELVVHLAAQINVRSSIKNPLDDADINIMGTLSLLNNMRKYDIEKIIFSSSGGAIYGDPKYLPMDEEHPISPLSPYGLSKYCCEEYIKLYNRLYGLDYVILRYSNVYGERQDPKGEAGVISIFINKMLNNERPTIFGDGNQTRDFVYVKDVANANYLAKDWKNEIVNIGTGEETSVNKLYNLISDIIHFDKEPIYADPIPGEVRRSCLNIKKARNLGWSPEFSLEEGIKMTVKYFKKIYSFKE